MPGFNGTGPEGKGSQTGRKMGKCNPQSKSNTEADLVQNTGFGRGCRGGGKSGRGSRQKFGPGRGAGRL